MLLNVKVCTLLRVSCRTWGTAHEKNKSQPFFSFYFNYQDFETPPKTPTHDRLSFHLTHIFMFQSEIHTCGGDSYLVYIWVWLSLAVEKLFPLERILFQQICCASMVLCSHSEKLLNNGRRKEENSWKRKYWEPILKVQYDKHSVFHGEI